MDLELGAGTVQRDNEIVDLYHARQHLRDLSGKLQQSDVAAKRRWVMSKTFFRRGGDNPSRSE